MMERKAYTAFGETGFGKMRFSKMGRHRMDKWNHCMCWEKPLASYDSFM